MTLDVGLGTVITTAIVCASTLLFVNCQQEHKIEVKCVEMSGQYWGQRCHLPDEVKELNAKKEEVKTK